MEKSLRNNLIQSLEKCSDAFRQVQAIEVQRIRYLVLVANDPWHHPVLKDIMNGIQPELEKGTFFFFFNLVQFFFHYFLYK